MNLSKVTIFINNKSVTFRHAQRRVKLTVLLKTTYRRTVWSGLDGQEDTLTYIHRL